MKEILLTQGYVAIVDDEDAERISRFKWHITINKSKNSHHVYAEATPKYRYRISMHRLIAGAGVGNEVDHINGNTLDNRRNNLRLCTRSQNNGNQRKTRGSSRYKGVCFDKQTGRWRAQIAHNGKRMKIGRFDIEEAAARAYRMKARELFGEFASDNLTDGYMPS